MASLFGLISRYWYQLSLFVLAIITLLSLIPLPELPPLPGSDKTHHFVAYGSLMFPVALRRPQRWLLIGCFFVVWSGGIELIQPLVNRYAEWLDLLANIGGIFIGVLFGFITRTVFLPKN